MAALIWGSVGRLSLQILFRKLCDRIVDTTRRSCWVLLINRNIPLTFVPSRSCTAGLLLVIDQGCFERRASHVLVLITNQLP